MRRNIRFAVLAILLISMFCSCGSIRYSQVAPEAKDFHPKRIGVLPADVETHEEARGVIDQIVAGELVNRKWFNDVLDADAINRQLHANTEFRNLVIDYKAKLRAVNFSDPDISSRIGELADIDAFLIIHVDYWNYTVESRDKIAKAGIGINLVNAKTGKILWKASHQLTESYWVIKPELSRVAKRLAAMMIDEMPH
jgi:hypothetical protein